MHREALEQCKFAAGPELGIGLEEVPVAPRALLWQYYLPIAQACLRVGMPATYSLGLDS